MKVIKKYTIDLNQNEIYYLRNLVDHGVAHGTLGSEFREFGLLFIRELEQELEKDE